MPTLIAEEAETEGKLPLVLIYAVISSPYLLLKFQGICVFYIRGIYSF